MIEEQKSLDLNTITHQEPIIPEEKPLTHFDHPKKEPLLKALTEQMGLVSHACQAMGITRQCYWLWCEADPIFKAAAQKAIWAGKQKMGDVAESELFKAIKAGNITAQIFYLKCVHKDRGYIERSEIEHSGGEKPIKFSGLQLEAAAKAYLKSESEKANGGNGDKDTGT